MRITLVGSRHFGVTTLNMLRQHGVEIARVVVADAEDRLAAAARAADIEVTVQADPKLVVAAEIAEGSDLIVTAHSHARIGRDALAAARLGGIGYHPSLLPRHRGIAADRMDHPRRRSDCGRQRLPPCRPHGCRCDRRPGVVFCRKGRERP